MVDKVRVVIADDHPITREGIKRFLANSSDIELVGEAEDGEAALQFVNELQPDVLLLDMELPGLKGLDVARRLNEDRSPVKILALSAHNEKRYILGLLAAGAHGYLTKEEIPDRILEAVQGVARGEKGWVSRRVAAIISAWTIEGEDNNQQLTAREKQVLKLVVEGKTNMEIGLTLGISQKTVEKHLESVFSKLNVGSRVEAAVMAVRDSLV